MTTVPVLQNTIAAPPPTSATTRKPRGLESAGWLTYVVLGLTALLSVAPFYYMIVAASHTMADMNQTPPPLIPGPDLWRNVSSAMDVQPLALAILNSLIVSGAVAVGTVFFCTLAGFAFAKLHFRGRNALFAITIGTLMIPPTLGVVPLYQVMSSIGLTGNLLSVILPTLVTAFGVFFMRQYLLQTMPDELLAAARVDGASTTRTFISIVVPIARPGMAVLAMLTFMATWNDFFWPLVALTSQNPTVQVALNNLGQGYVPDQSVIMAGTLVGTLPVIVVFALMGRQIVSGIMAGAVKG